MGSVTTALVNWLFARHHGGTFVLRIEDTDAARATEESLRGVLGDLRWLGLHWDEGPEVGGPHEPYVQTQRSERHREAARRLLKAGQAYHCYCSKEELDARRQQALAEGRAPGYDGRCRDLTDAERAASEEEGRTPVVRLRVPEGETHVTDLIHGDIRFEHGSIRDFVIVRSDGTPLYQLANAVDDHDMGITHVIRGEDLLPSTPNQILLYRALGAEPLPGFAHVPLILGPDRQKLGKRHGHTAIADYRAEGFLPEAMVNYLVLLNWSYGDGTRERFTVEELVAHFDLPAVTRNPSIFDAAKLTALNGEKIRALDPEDLRARLEPSLAATGVLSDPVTEAERETLRSAVPLIQERMARLDEAAPLVRFLFRDVPPDAHAAAALGSSAAPLLEQALDVVEKVEPFEAAPLHDALMEWADATGLKRKEALQPVRAAITGSLVSPPLFESMAILGREVSLARIRRAIGRARA